MNPDASRPVLMAAPIAPARVLVIDVDGVIPGIAADHHRSASVLTRLGGRPVGRVDLDLSGGDLTSEQVAGALDSVGLRDVVATSGDLLRADATTAPPEAPKRVSVVIATCGDIENATECIDSLLGSHGVDIEVIVVDNRPEDHPTAARIAERFDGEPRVRTVEEPRRGLSSARNRGISEASNDLIAWTDDDVIVDPEWARWLVEAFDAAPDVDLVTGLVRPLELETQAQVWREIRRGYGKGFEPRTWRLSETPPGDRLFPYQAGRIGTGANMAARADFLGRVGGFDPALGAGTPSGGGEDLDLILRALLSGSAVRYEPAAMVSHRHHETFDALVDQTRAYGEGLAAYLVKWLTADAATSWDMIRRSPLALIDFVRTGDLSTETAVEGSVKGPPRARMVAAEVRGLATGAYRYLASAKKSRSGWADPSRS